MAMVDREILGSIMRSLNPWWQGRSFASEPFRRSAYRQCRRSLEHPSLNRAVLLRGPRRVGKTTLLMQIAEHLLTEREVAPERICYLALNHPVLKGESLGSLVDLYHEGIAARGPGAYLLLDEVQQVEGWQQDLGRLMADGPGYRVLAAGSGPLAPPPGADASGVGRWVSVSMPVLSFFEYAHLLGKTDGLPEFMQLRAFAQRKPEDLAEVAASFESLRPLLGHYLLAGGFPEAARRAPIGEALGFLQREVIERVLYPGGGVLQGVRKPEHLERLLLYLCLHAGRPFSPESCAQALASNRGTVLSHLEALEAAQLIARVPPYRPGGRKVQRARDLVHLADAALRSAILMRGTEVLDDPVEAGLLMEGAVFRHVHAAYERDMPILGYWRDAASNRKVDLAAGSPGRIRAVAVTYRSQAPVDPKGGLAAFLAREHGAVAAYQVTRDDADFGVTRLPGVSAPVLRVPAHIFLYAVGMSEQRVAAGAEDAGL